jgi:hypothetical protein
MAHANESNNDNLNLKITLLAQTLDNCITAAKHKKKYKWLKLNASK